MKPIYFLLPNNLAERTSLQQFGFLLLFISASLLFYNLLAPLLVLLAGYSIDLLREPKLSSLSSNEILLLKLFQVGGGIFVFVFPTLLFEYLMRHSGEKNYLCLQTVPLPVHIGKVLLVIPLILPLIVWLAYINENLTLPAVFQYIETWVRESEREAGKMIRAFLKMQNIGQLLFNLLVMAVLPALGEELLFRGCIQQIFQRGLRNPHLAIWLAGALFSFIHFQFLGFLPRMAVGIILGYLFYYSGNLWLPILVHFLYNGFQVCLVYIHQNEIINGFPETNNPFSDMPYGILTPLLLIFLSVGTLWYLLPSFRQQMPKYGIADTKLNTNDTYPGNS